MNKKQTSKDTVVDDNVVVPSLHPTKSENEDEETPTNLSTSDSESLPTGSNRASSKKGIIKQEDIHTKF